MIVNVGSLKFNLERKPIKHLRVSVLPPLGEVLVSAPENMTDTSIRMAVIHRIPWIRKQQTHFAMQDRQSLRELVNGETHYLWGRRYRLEVVEFDLTLRQSNSIKFKNGKLVLTVSDTTSPANRLKLLNEYYRTRLKARAPDLIEAWAKRIGVRVEGWQVQKMKTKWGSCNIEKSKILLNLDLAKKPISCLEYIIAHELIHFKERQHNDRFKALLDRHMPDWRSRRQLLNELPLSDENWKEYE